MRVSVDLGRAYRLLNHGPTTLVTSASGGRTNVMAAQWVMPQEMDPARVVIVIDPETYTHELVMASGELALSIPCAAQAELVWKVGSSSGRDVDKLASIPTSPASVVAAPLVDGCVAWLECRLVADAAMAARWSLYVFDIVAAWADDTHWRDDRWQFASDDARTLHHQGRGVFYVTGDVRVGRR